MTVQEARAKLSGLMRRMAKQIAADNYVGERADAFAALLTAISDVLGTDPQAKTRRGLLELCRQCEQQLATKYVRLETIVFKDRVD